MVVTHHQKRLLLYVLIISVFYKVSSQDLNCGDVMNCAYNSYICSGSPCVANCNTDNSCQSTRLECNDDALHSVCEINCYGVESCKNMDLISYRDTVINCIGEDSCDGLRVYVYGNDPNDKIDATITSTGSYTDDVIMECHNDGISECLIDCVDNGLFYTCIDVDLDCYTKGTCRHHCDANACCGCTLPCGLNCNQAHENNLRCYEGDGNNNCIKEDPGGCQEAYGCILKDVFPTPNPTPSPTTRSPTPAPTKQPTKTPTKYPTRIPTWKPTTSPTLKPSFNPTPGPTADTISPTKSPTPAPTTLPTKTPTFPEETPNPSIDPTKAPTPAPTDNPTSDPTIDPTTDPTHHPTKDPTNDPTNNPTSDPTTDPTFVPTLEPTYNPTLEPSNAPSSSPTFPPTSAPTRNRDEPDFCISVVETVENLIGIETNDFIQDDKLQFFFMNSTKLVIYDAIRGSNKYDMHKLCKNFWKCFFVKLINIGGKSDTVFDIDVCAWDKNVHDALLDKMVDDQSEMEAYMKQLLEFYINGPQYHGYNGIIFTNRTRVLFRLATTTTPAPTGNGGIDTTITGLETTKSNINVNETAFHEQYMDYILYGGIGLLLVSCCIAAIICFYCNKQRKMKKELAETKRHVERLKSLSDIDTAHNLSEGGMDNENEMAEGIGNVAVDGHTVPMTVPMNNNNNNNNNNIHHETNIPPPLTTNAQTNWHNGYQQFHAAHSPVSSQIAMQNMSLSNISLDQGMMNAHNQMMNVYAQQQQMMMMHASPPSPHQSPIQPITPMGSPGNDEHDEEDDDDDLPDSDKEDENDGLYDAPSADNKKTAGNDDDIPQNVEAIAADPNALQLKYGDENANNDEYEYYEEYEEYEYDENGQYEEVEQNGSPLSKDDENGDDKNHELEFCSYEEIKNGEVLKGVDNKEQYLNDEEFEEVFSMNKEKFNSLKPWKQKSLRVAKGLF